MKKLIAAFLAITFIFILPFQSYAAEKPSLQSVAEKTICKSADLTAENPTITYSGIDEFVNTVHSELPNINDTEISDFLVEYTNQSKDSISDKEKANYLKSKEIIITDRFIRIDSAGNKTELDYYEIIAAIDRERISITLDEYTSDNGYLQFKTVISRQSDIVDDYVDYRVGAYAIWLKMPKFHLTDHMFINFSENVVFDSGQPIYGKLEETISCHGTESHYKSQVWKTDDNPDYFTNKNVYVENNHRGGAIAFKIKPAFKIKCDCGSLIHFKKLTSISAYVSFGISVKAGEMFNIQPVYGHTKPIGFRTEISLDGNIFPANTDTYISDKATFTAYNG